MPRLSFSCKLRLALEILATYLEVRWLFARHELPDAVSRLRAVPSGRLRHAPPLAEPGEEARLGRAVVRVLGLLPSDSRCLMRSLVLLRLLARRHAGPSLVIAVRPSHSAALDAHAWIELDGRPLLEPATDDYGRLLTL